MLSSKKYLSYSGPDVSSIDIGVGEGAAFWPYPEEKSRIPETKNLSTDADSRTDTVLEKLRDFMFFFVKMLSDFICVQVV